MTRDEAREDDDRDTSGIDDPFAELGEGVDNADHRGDERDDSVSTHDGESDPDVGSDPDTESGPDSGSGPDAESDTPLFDAETRSSSSRDDASQAGSESPTSSASEPTPGVDPFDELEAADWPEDAENAFKRMDVAGAADEDVWESLDADLSDPDPGAFDPDSGARTTDSGFEETESFDGDADGPEHVVDKRAYCQQCPHFSAPPDATCTHEGTTIVEVVNADEFRVRNCPMISEGDPRFNQE